MLAGGDSDRKAQWAKKIWRRHIERAARFGYRTTEQIAWDNFVAPHRTATVGDWLRWMRENGMEYRASFPSFYGVRLPSQASGGIQQVAPTPPPRSPWLRRIVPLVVQIRWALALRVGGFASISFLARKQALLAGGD